MITTSTRMVGMGLLFLCIFLTGFWLSRLGKPYNGGIFNLHKLIALATLVFLILTVKQVRTTIPLTPTMIAGLAISGLCFAATVISGGLVSVGKLLPEAVGGIHKVLPYLSLLSTGGTLYLLLNAR
jgi:hypothetical protein